MTLSYFLNGYTSVFLYSRYSLCFHSVRVTQKTVACCTKNYVVSTKNYVVHQNYRSVVNLGIGTSPLELEMELESILQTTLFPVP